METNLQPAMRKPGRSQHWPGLMKVMMMLLVVAELAPQLDVELDVELAAELAAVRLQLILMIECVLHLRPLVQLEQLTVGNKQ